MYIIMYFFLWLQIWFNLLSYEYVTVFFQSFAAIQWLSFMSVRMGNHIENLILFVSADFEEVFSVEKERFE